MQNQTPSLLMGREVILGVGGGVSAYKSAELLRRLQELGLGVTVIPTTASLNFVGLATWEALSGREVPNNLWNNIHDVPHIKLAKKSSAIIVAPATYDLIGKIANGLANDLLTNVIAASTSPIILVPAMHTEMWQNPINQENISKLKKSGIYIIEPEVGRMTGEDTGIGRYPEVNTLINQISEILSINSDYLGKNVLVTAGGTREFLDPVRYLGNISSGKQGLAIAKEARSRGAKVTLISANVDLPAPLGVEIIKVESADQMQAEISSRLNDLDLLVMSAAVADVKPAKRAEAKIRKNELQGIEVVANPDILQEISKRKNSSLVVIAFAAETGGDIEAEAKRKLFAKGAHLIFANDVSQGQVFGQDQTSGIILDSEGNRVDFTQGSKDTLAQVLLDQAKNKLG
jgi:phosphopantothenoylcysteine decarboxylase / phosphopantothenate---cysteine ligase